MTKLRRASGQRPDPPGDLCIDRGGRHLRRGGGQPDRRSEGLLPAAYDEVLSTTAINDSDGQAGGLGPQAVWVTRTTHRPASATSPRCRAQDQRHTIAAPGECIGSTYPGGGYASDSGTSFASPLNCRNHRALHRERRPTVRRADAGTDRPQDCRRRRRLQHHPPSYGFSGDPLHSPNPGRYYGYLINAGLY